MAPQRILAGGGAKQRDHLTGGDAFRQLRDPLGLFLHFFEITTAIDFPRDRRSAILAVKIGVQFTARADVLDPLVPRLVLLRQSSWTIAADEQAEPVVRSGVVIPASGLDWHRRSLQCPH